MLTDTATFGRPALFDVVHEAGEGSFPASDPPAFTPAAALSCPLTGRFTGRAWPDVAPAPVTEHRLSDPACRG